MVYIHPVYNAGLWIHNLLVMSHLPQPLDHGFSPIIFGFIVLGSNNKFFFSCLGGVGGGGSPLLPHPVCMYASDWFRATKAFKENGINNNCNNNNNKIESNFLLNENEKWKQIESENFCGVMIVLQIEFAQIRNSWDG